MGKTAIQWTSTQLPDGSLHHGYSFNTHQGCVEQGPECDNCYARDIATRWGKDIWGKDKPRSFQSEKYWLQPHKWNKEGEKLQIRLKVFANSMSDLFENRSDLTVPRERLFKTINETGWLDWLLLTKLPNNITNLRPPILQNQYLPNVWYGASVGVNKSRWRIDRIRNNNSVPIRFLSLEPLLEPLPELDLTNINWAIVGGESGPRARECKVEWIDDIIRQCRNAGVAIFIKQMGRVLAKQFGMSDLHGGNMDEFPEHLRIREFPNP